MAIIPKNTGPGILLCFFLMVLTTSTASFGQEELAAFDMKVREWAAECRDLASKQLEILVHTGKITSGDIFDTFYIPIQGTSPQKYSTRYDKYADLVLQAVLDDCLGKDKKLVFVIAVDKNGYVPTHNSRYSQPVTGDMEADADRNRAKRIFNDRTGLAAARNKKDFLLQTYSRDTGDKMKDLSMPIFIMGRHWGALRVGYMDE